MKHAIVGLTLSLILIAMGTVFAQTAIDFSTSDFDPPQGATTSDDPKAQSGPWNQRLMTAFSEDEGLTWTRTNQVIADQADVPTAFVDSEGRIFVYYVTYYEPFRNNVVTAVSEDGGLTWVHKRLDFGNIPARPAPTDPAIVQLEDGRVRLYFIRGIDQPQHLVSMSAISEDGIHFTIEDGIRLDSRVGNVFCAAILSLNGQYHLFSPSTSNMLVHAVSDDGLNYTELPPLQLPGNYFMGKGVIETADGYRVFAHQGSPDKANFVPSIVSFITTDGLTFTKEEGTRLQPDAANGLESVAVRNPSVIRLPDNRLMMFYVALIPK
ncbi:MAG: sialidase family protein [Anaerolineae bacterium]